MPGTINALDCPRFPGNMTRLEQRPFFPRGSGEMPQIINTNILSLNAQRNLNTSQGALSTASQRLSSGLRVNNAKDDAAGMAIAENMNTQSRGMIVAMRNANNGISAGASGQYDEINHRALNAEFAQLRSEIERVIQARNS